MPVSKLFEADKITTLEEVPKPLQIEFVMCEICFEIIARVNMEDFEVPMVGKIFLSKDAKHNYPDPFPPTLDWMHMKCPYCRWRPFLHQHKFINDKEEWCGYLFECKNCGVAYDNHHGLMGHMARTGHKGEENAKRK